MYYYRLQINWVFLTKKIIEDRAQQVNALRGKTLVLEML
jgi:hypothetical protein